jgi:hypothetical protein
LWRTTNPITLWKTTMINPKLYEGLCALMGHPGKIIDEDDPGTFSCPTIGLNRATRLDKRYAHADQWGEKYHFDCPVCEDTRGRLVIGHQYQQKILVKNMTYYFGDVYACYNERCDLWRVLKDLPPDSMQQEMSELHKEVKPTAFTAYEQPAEDFPGKTIPIISSDVPEDVTEYLHKRGFNPMDLHQYYMVRYAPKGTVWHEDEDGKKKVFYEDRLLIPIIQKGYMVTWQARVIGEGTPKYVNGKNSKTSHCLYNMDTAKYKKDIVLFEGVTDVWRWGPQSMALFGKKLSRAQTEMLRIIWGWKGWDSTCVICLDPDAIKKGLDDDYVKYLQGKQIFQGGVASAKLYDGDPADHSIADLRAIVEEARAQCR